MDTVLAHVRGERRGDARLHRGEMIEAELSLEDAEVRLREVLGRPLTDEERAELDAAHARAQALGREHGPDYHGFGNPPDRKP